jgi:hypothetical protein
MSDTPQGPDWWQASDDKWYPPPRPQMPGEADSVAAPVGAGYAPPAGPPAGPPMGPPMGGPSGGYGPIGPGPGPGAPGPGPGGPGFPPGAHSPYGGMPAGPGGPPPNRTPLYVAIGGVAAAAVVGTILLLSSGGDDPEPPGPRQQTTEATPETSDPDVTEPGTVDITRPEPGEEDAGEVAALEVADQGFSAFDSDDGPAASYGLIVRNTGDQPIETFYVNVDLYDDGDALFHSWSFEIGRIDAGADLGIGEHVIGDVPNGVSRMEVAFEDREFADPMPDGTLSLEGEVGFAGDDYYTDISYTAASTYPVDLEFAHAYAILRDASNKIVGAEDDFITKVPANGKTADTISINNLNLPPGVDHVEVYVDAGTIF